MRDKVLERLELAAENHPNAGAKRLLWLADADPSYLEAAEAIVDGESPTEPESTDSTSEDLSREPPWASWADADFATPASGVWPDELLEREQWMGHVEKKPFAPWGDQDAPAECSKDGHDTAATCECDARWKWGYRGHYVDGETVAMAEIDPRLDGRSFLQREDDPYVYVDGDDVRDPETGDVHPAFIAILEHLGATYCDISTSGKGVHAIYRGDFEDLDLKQASWRLDEDPWGSIEGDLPSIEIYPGKRVCVMTGDHVPGTPTEVRKWNADVLEPLCEATGQFGQGGRDRDEDDVSVDREDYDLDDYEPTTTSSSETTDDIRDVFAAIDQLDAQRVADQTIVQRWNDSASTSGGERAFWPTWGSLNDGGTANICNNERWQDTGELGGYGGVVTMAAIDASEIRPANARPVDGETWWRGVERLRDLGFDIPEYESDDAYKGSDDGRAVSALPIGQLDALEPAERGRFAKKRGLEWPSTDDAREELSDTIAEVIRNEDDRIVDAPTSLGKSYTIASTRWGAREEITGDRPVVHLLETRDARDEAVDVAEEHGGQYHVLFGRHEACPVAAGEHDDEISINGEPASEWLDAQCDGKGMAFSAAHRYLEENNDQGVTLPCKEEGECTAISQWETFRDGPDGELEYWPLVIATHNFAYAPGLRMHNNIVVDEEPSYEEDRLSTDRIRDAVGAYLREIDAPVSTWEAFIQLSLHDDYQGDAAKERDALEDVLYTEPDRDWYFEDPDAHTLAPALARAIFRAEDRANGRRFGKTGHEPPRLEAGAHDSDEWNREWVSIVLDESNDVRSVRVTPDFSSARSLVGLDAHPAVPLWQANTTPWIKTKQVLEPEERQLWRRYERGLRVVQVGDATRPLSGDKALEWLNEDKLEVLLDQLVDEYGVQFRTAITTGQVEDRLEELMENAGVHRPELMHFGEEKSRNDFEHERVGLVNGCMDPGDDYVLDLLAELDLEAEVETAVDDAGDEYRARGRGFEGEDADSAAEILASVRENHIAQAAGRYARDPSDPDVNATVFVRTDAMPPGFADVQTPGVEWVFTDLQEEIVEELRSSKRSKSAREIAESVGCSKEHVRQTLERLSDNEFGEPAVHVSEGVGSHGATLYSESGTPSSGFVDLQESPTTPYGDSSRWSLAIRDPTTRGDVDQGVSDGSSETPTEVWDWRSPPDPSD
ncbi:hypothetical protein GS429_08285 [Natronorubrum sp. JWXQ-INN-674]|uniref:Uncharacterized protein n=1 Tax=Natronorubrum halalkaliphilum TaxID=2691917 RepID=A0A6B0VLV2_9EURY|nr:hypothetical protein [Natronorubrum halalkaliphilum]MXV62057.1 hypothetical protein [Natronorubrum halalkaliphilum]